MKLILTNYFKDKTKLIPGIYLLISAVIVGFGQPAWSISLSIFASIFGFALCFEALSKISLTKQRFYTAWIWYTLVECIHLSWMTSIEYQGLYILALYLIISLVIGLQFGFLMVFLKNSKKMGFSRILMMSGLWVILEWSRLFFMSGFPFNPVGLSMAANNYSLQLASVGGIYLLSFWVMLTNLVAYKCFFSPYSINNLVLWLTLAAAPYLFGWAHLSYHNTQMAKGNYKTINSLLVQTALNPEEKMGQNGLDKMMHPMEQWCRILNYLATYQDQSIDLILMPESSVPFSESLELYPIEHVKEAFVHFLDHNTLDYLPDIKKKQKRVGNAFISQFISNYFNADVIIGLENDEKATSGEIVTYGSAFKFSPFKKNHEVYHKRILLPVVEYLPFKWCQKLAKRYGILGWFERGTQGKLFSGKTKISPSICIEELYSSIIRKNKKLGTELFVNMTNDVWFPNSRLPRQHFDHGKVRVIENGTPSVRACNTGITCGVDALGRNLGVFSSMSKKAQWDSGVVKVAVPLYHYSTLFTLWGNGFILFLSLGFVGYFAYKRNLLLKNKLVVS